MEEKEEIDFIPEEEWKTFCERMNTLFDIAPSPSHGTSTPEKEEK